MERHPLKLTKLIVADEIALSFPEWPQSSIFFELEIVEMGHERRQAISLQGIAGKGMCDLRKH